MFPSLYISHGSPMLALEPGASGTALARSVAELLAGAGRCPDYEALSEVDRIRLLVDEIATPRPLYSPYLDYSEETRGELAIFFAARELRQRYGAAALPNSIISKTDGVSDLLELALLLKEAGLLRPGKQAQSDEEIWSWMKRYATSVHHAVGTVKMGAADDAMAPLTPDLKVKGISGLRVVDASVMPNIISGNTNAPVVAIASKAAQMILADAH